jgi:hypothetical protein
MTSQIPRRTFLGAAVAASALGAGVMPGGTDEGPRADAGEGELPQNGPIWAGPFPSRQIWGYVDKHSVLSGGRFNLMLSTGPDTERLRGRIAFYRAVDEEPETATVWTSPLIDVAQQSVSVTAATIGANWPVALADIDVSSWPPGYYSADFVTESGDRERQIAQIIVRDPRAAAAVLLRLSTNTYQAYNPWGGHSLYPRPGERQSQGAIVSFDRPTPPAFFEYEVYLLRWLEALGRRAGFSVECVSNFDVHRDPELLLRYKIVISGAHDEYWSKEEFDAFEHRIFHRGGNTIFMGANAAYWQVRYADLNAPQGAGAKDVGEGRQLVSYKSLEDPILRRASDVDPMLLVTARFRDAARRPETMLMGVAYQNWFQPQDDGGPRYAYRVVNTDAPFFEGTGYRPGDVAAEVVGYEWDNRDPAGNGQRLWDAQRSRIAPLPPERIQVLFAGDAIGEDGTPGRAEAVYFTSPAGAKVFSAGSIRWSWGLGKPGFERDAFKRFSDNLLTGFLA